MKQQVDSKKNKLKIKEVDLSFLPNYGIFVLDDDYIPFDFVVDFLCRFFDITDESAEKIALEAHEKGKSLCKVFPQNLAESIYSYICSIIKNETYQLKFVMEKV